MNEMVLIVIKTFFPFQRCYRNSDCPSDLLCCYDACLGQTCKNPEFRKNEIAVKPMLFV